MANIFDGFQLTNVRKSFEVKPEKPKKKKKKKKKPPPEPSQVPPTAPTEPPPQTDPPADNQEGTDPAHDGKNNNHHSDEDDYPEGYEPNEFMKWVTNSRYEDMPECEDTLFNNKKAKSARPFANSAVGKRRGAFTANRSRSVVDARTTDKYDDDYQANEFMKWVTNTRTDDVNEVENALFGHRRVRSRNPHASRKTSRGSNSPSDSASGSRHRDISAYGGSRHHTGHRRGHSQGGGRESYADPYATPKDYEEDAFVKWVLNHRTDDLDQNEQILFGTRRPKSTVSMNGMRRIQSASRLK